MQGIAEKFKMTLAVQITGVVFWGLLFVCSLISVVVLQRAETAIESKNSEETLILSYEIEKIVEQFTTPPVLDQAGDLIKEKIHERMANFDFHAVRIHENNKLLSIGVIGNNDELYEYTLSYLPSNSTNLQTIKLDVYCANVRSEILALRKQVLLSIGFGVFVFVFFLQIILKRILSVPFRKMVTTAEQFSKGKEDVRFDEERIDEFGYLGKFINNAIDSILSHKNNLMTALERASASEIALSLEKERAEVTLYSITDTVVTVDVNEYIAYMNPAGEKLLRTPAEDIIGKQFKGVFNIVKEGTGEPIDDLLAKCFVTGNIFHLPEHSSLIANNDSVVSIEASIAPMTSDTGDLMGAVIVIQDVSHTRRLTKQLSYQASHDLLTGLYNRRKFEEYLEEILVNVRAENRNHSLFYMDLDNFKIVNDTCGHVAGDELLKQLPALLDEVLRSGDIVARLGGDEFGVILENCGVQQAAAIANKIRQKIKNYRFVWDDKIFEIGVSIGVIAINAENAEMSQILSSADVACYTAKDSGRNLVHVYEPSDKAMSERYGQMHWTAKISQALEENSFQLYQQPIVGLSDKTRYISEILIRMIDKDGKVISPGAFMPAAERYGLMPEIDHWVIHEVFSYMSRQQSSNPGKSADDLLAINLSGDSISNSTLLSFIIEQKNIYGISLNNICFEITETAAISNLAKATVIINELKKYGCKFALDDFGSGLSSFAYLKTLPVDYLKIDGCFVKDISHDAIDRAMVESIQQIGRVMKLKTIAEHVEDEETLQVLKDIGVDFVQGYYMGRPQAIHDHEAVF